jgi:RNA polymerase sigma-70 factor, ECF subfamily
MGRRSGVQVSQTAEIGHRVGIAAQEADLEARFAAFVEAHRARAVRLAWRLLRGDTDAAEDVAQEAFARAWQGLAGFRGEATLGTWFYRILVRQAASHRRFRGLRERFGGLGNREDAPDPAPQPAGDPTLRRRIAAALDALPRRQREVFVLVHLEEFTVRETAEIVGRAPGTVKSHLHRALRALRRDLHDLIDAHEIAPGEPS